MEPDHAEYWRATDQVLDLAREIILRPDSVRTALVDSFLDFRPGFLIRVVNNLAAAEYLQIAEHLGFNLNDHRIISALLHPLAVFEIVPAAQASTEDTEKAIFRGVREFCNHERRLDDAIVPLYVEHTVAPTAHVLNGAMPVIVALMTKCILLEECPPACSPQALEAQLNSAIGLIRSRLRSWLKI